MVSPRKENSWMVDILLKILGVPQQFPMVKRSSFLSNDLGDLGSDLLLWLKSVLKISDYWLRRVRGRCRNEGRQGRSTWWGVPKLIPENPFIAWLACCIRLLLGRLLPHRKCLLSCGWIVFGFDFFCHIRRFLSWYFQAHTRLEFWTNIPKGILEILVAQHPKSAHFCWIQFILESMTQTSGLQGAHLSSFSGWPRVEQATSLACGADRKGSFGVRSGPSLPSSAIGQRIL